MSFNLEEYFEEFYKKLKHIIKTRAPILHSSKTTEYGKATDSEYGHVKVEKSLVDTENPVESSVIKNNVDGINNNIDGINTRIDGMTVDTELDNQSKKPVENRVITNKINSLDGTTLKLNGLTDQTLEDAINVRIPGKDGKGLEFVFKRMSIMIDDWDDEKELPAQTINPAKLDAVQEDDYVPDGWTDDQEEVTWEIPYQYVSTRTKEVISKEDGGDDYTGIWNKFTTPKLWSVYGEKPFCHLRYADEQDPTNWNDTFPQPQTDTTSGGMNYHKYEGYLWNEEQVLSDENKDPTLFTWRIYRPTIGVAGKEGSFLHIAYAMNEAGDGFNQYEGDYIGTCVTWEEEDPDDPDLYNWVRIKGNAGIDTEFVYYTTNVENFTGKPTNIKNQPELKKWCERPYPVSEANPYCYISVKDVKDSTWSDAVLWAKYGEQGETGERGPEGERGEDGIGLEMIFRRNSTTTTAPGFVNGQNNSSFQGTVTRKVNGVNKAFYYQDDDFVPEYWTDDQQGVSATSGQQVEWVCMRFKKIGDDGKIAEWGDFNEPKVWATYSKDGKGVTSIVEKYYLYTSYQSLPSGLKDSDWLPTAPTVTEGKYLWAKSFITYTDNTVDTTDPVCITGRDGDGVHYIYYCYNSTNKPNPPTKWSDIHGNTNTSADYGRWIEDPVSVTESNQYLYMSESTTHSYDSNGNKIWVDFKPSVLWASYSEDAISVMLGNEAQLIAVDGNGSLKSNPTTITIPVYCYKGTNKIAGTINLSSISNTFSAKTVTREPTTTNDGGLITLQCTSVPTQITKNEPIIVTVDGKTYTKYFTWSKIGDGKDGNDGGTFDFVYYTKNDATTPTISSSTTINANTGRNVVGAWCARPTNVSSSYQYCFGAYRKLDYNGNPTGNYSDVYLWAKYGATGSSGTSHEYAYYTTSSATAPTKPSGNITETTGTEKWTTVPVAMTLKKKYMYISYRINGGTWSNTALWSQFGDKGETGAKGKDGVGLEHIFYLSDTEINWDTNDNLYNDPVTTDTSSKYAKINCTLSFNTDRLIMTRTVSNGASYIEMRIESTEISKYLGKKVRFECDIISATGGCYIQIYQLINGTYSGSGYSASITSGHLTKEWVIDKNATRIIFRIFGTNTGLNGTCSFRNFKVSSFTDPTKWSTTGDFQDDDYVMSNTGWTDDATGVDETHKFEYCSIRTKTPNEQGTGVWGAFGEPSLWAKFGERGTGAVNVTTAPSTYTTTTGGFTPSYRISLSTVKTQSGLSEIMVGDYLRYSFYVYPIGYIDNNYVYTSDRISIRGESGRAVSTVENQYSASSSKTTPPTSNWKTVITQVTTFNSTNKYLWNKEVSKDADGEVISESTPHVIAEYGTNGGISSIVEEYALSTDTTAPSSGWQTSPIPTMSSTNKYLWNHEVITYINNATYTSPAKIIGVYGDRGLTGEDGADGEGLEMIFCRTQTPNGYSVNPSTLPAQPTTPDYLPTGWTDDPSGVNETYQYEYVCMRTKTPNSSGEGEWGSFNSPSLWAKYGEDGKPGDKIYEITKEPTAVSNQSYKYSIAWANLGSSYRAELKIGDMLVWHNATNKNTYIYKIVGITVNQYAYLSKSTLLSGADGDGLEMIFCRSQEITSIPGFTGIQNTPSFTGTVKRNGVNYKFQDDDYVPDGWTDNQSGVNEVDKYEWVSMRQKVPDKEGTSKWGEFSSPSLWASYSEKGKDGTEITGDEIMTKIEGQSIDAQTIGGISPSELITTTLLETDKVMDSSNHGFYKAFKMGRIIVLIFKDYLWTPPNTSGNQTVVTLPTWAKNVVSPRTYFTNFNGDVVSVTDGGVFTYSPKSTTTVNISGTFVYIGDNAPSISTSISLGGSQISVTSGGSVTVTLTSGGKALGNKPVRFQINNQVYTKTTKNTGQASLNINLSNGTYTLSAEFQGDKTYSASSTTATLTVGKIANAFFSKPSGTNNILVKSGTSANPGQPISNLNCKANLEGTFHYMSTDYKGIINTKSMLNTFKGTKTITFYNNDSRVTSLPSAGFSLTGTRATQDYTKTLSPNSVGGSGINSDYQDKEGTWWNYATAGSLINKNDGAYAQTDILNPGAQGQDLYVSFNTGIPTNASIKEVVVSVNCGARHGWNSSMKPIFNNCTVKIINSAGTDLLGAKSMPAYNQNGCDNWYTSSYSWTNTFTNSNNQFLYPAVVFQNIRNSSSDYNGRFGIDWVSMYVKYEI